MDKRGFLLAEETLKIILAVIAIGFLAYLLFSIYSVRKEARDLEFAISSIDFLMTEMNNEKTEIEIYNPSGWWIASWPYQGIMPNFCSNLDWENCLCIFPKGILARTPSAYADDSNNGVCKEVSKKVIVSSIEGKQFPIKIADPPLILNVNYGDEILITKK